MLLALTEFRFQPLVELQLRRFFGIRLQVQPLHKLDPEGSAVVVVDGDAGGQDGAARLVDVDVDSDEERRLTHPETEQRESDER